MQQSFEFVFTAIFDFVNFIKLAILNILSNYQLDFLTTNIDLYLFSDNKIFTITILDIFILLILIYIILKIIKFFVFILSFPKKMLSRWFND